VIQEEAHFGAALFARGAVGQGQRDPDDEAFVSVGVPGADVQTSASTQTFPGAGEVCHFTIDAQGNATDDSSVEMMPSPQSEAHFGQVLNEDAIGAPDARDGSKADTGYVEIQGTGFWGQHAGDHLGVSLAYSAAPLADDDDVGMLVGAPGHTVGTAVGAGEVNEYLFDPDEYGASFYRLLTQASHGIPGKPARGAHFGASVAWIAVDNAPGDRLSFLTAIGAPGATVGRIKRAGAVILQVKDFNKHGRVATNSWSRLTLASPGVPGKPRNDDGFGEAMTAYQAGADTQTPAALSIGAPGFRAASESAIGAVVTVPTGLSGPKNKSITTLRPTGTGNAGSQFGKWIE
jgi:hypothetical protein